MCEVCGGCGYREVIEDGVSCVTPCKCQRAPFRILEYAGVPETLIGKDLKNFVPSNQVTARALKMAQVFVDKWPNVKKGLVFQGYTGTGKSHLAAAIMRALAVKGESRMVFWDARDLMNKIKATFKEGSMVTESEILDRIAESQLFVLDDLGAERLTEWSASVIEQILANRYNRGRAVIITTNYQDDNERGEPSLADRVGPRIRSRLYEMAFHVPVLAVDHRKKGAGA